MGNPSTEGLFGDDCLYCYDSGKTPLRMNASFTGITRCPGKVHPTTKNPNILIYLIQTDFAPCQWEGQNNDGFECTYVAYWSNRTLLWLAHSGKLYFYKLQSGPCRVTLENGTSCVTAATMGEGGIGSVAPFTASDPNDIHALFESMNIEGNADTFWEHAPISLTQRQVKIASRIHDINIRFKQEDFSP